MTSGRRFRDRIASCAFEKNSRIIVALDVRPEAPGVDSARSLEKTAKDVIEKVQGSACAIKINFHLLLPLSASQVASINEAVHSHGLLSIADIKLNDIEQTNEIALEWLLAMGFDCVIANPFIGQDGLGSLARKAHEKNAGVVALVHMSHPGAREGYGLDVLDHQAKKRLSDVFLDRAISADADGIVVGATQSEILSDLRRREIKPPVYSPGIGAQGATVEDAVNAGCDFLIIGRSIVDSGDPRAEASMLQARVSKALSSRAKK